MTCRGNDGVPSPQLQTTSESASNEHSCQVSPETRAYIQNAVLEQVRSLEKGFVSELNGVLSRIKQSRGCREGQETLAVDADSRYVVESFASQDSRDDAKGGKRRTSGTACTASESGQSAVSLSERPRCPEDGEESDDVEGDRHFHGSLTPTSSRGMSLIASPINTPRSEGCRPSRPDISLKMLGLLQSSDDAGLDAAPEAKSRVSGMDSSRSSGSWRVEQLDVGDLLASRSAARKGSASVESIVALVQHERDRWAEEKAALEARLEELKVLNETRAKIRVDPEKVEMRKKLQELRETMKTRSRFGAWVCERHMEESDDDDDPQEQANRAVRDRLRNQMGALEAKLREARKKAGIVTSNAQADQPASSVAAAPRTGLKSGNSKPAKVLFREHDSFIAIQSGQCVHSKRVCFDAGQDGGSESDESSSDEEDDVDVGGPDILPGQADANKGAAQKGGAKRTIQFQNEPNVSEASQGERRSVRTRIPTGYVGKDIDEPPQEVHEVHGKSINFAESFDEVEAASTLPPEGVRSVRTRIPTGYVTKDTHLQLEGQPGADTSASVKFQDAHEEVEASSLQPPGGGRSVRTRIPTGYVSKEVNIQFEEPPSGTTTACSSPGGRSAKSRISCDDDDDVADCAVRFQDSHDEVEASSVLPPEGGRSVRTRMPTGYVSASALVEAPTASAANKGVKFHDTSEEVEAASTVPPAQGQTSNGKPAKKTKFETEERSAAGGVKFQDAHDEVASASVMPPEGGRSVRTRIPTGYVSNEAHSELEHPPIQDVADKGVKFQDAQDVVEAASVLPAQGGRSVRTRIPTGYGSNEAEMQIEPLPKGVMFQDSHDEVVAASVLPTDGGRSVRARVPTGYVSQEPLASFGDQPNGAPRGVNFSVANEEVEAASVLPSSGGRPVRSRTPTGYVSSDVQLQFTDVLPSDALPQQASDKGVKFQAAHDEVDAASVLPSTGARSSRTRIPTGYVSSDTQAQLEEPSCSKRGVNFQEAYEEVQAASVIQPGGGRQVRTRTPTGYVSQDVQLQFEEQPESNTRGVKFHETRDEVQAASELPPQGGRPVRTRTPTGFVSNETQVQFDDQQKGGAGGVKFQSAPGEVSVAAVSSVGDRGVQFNNAHEEVEAASVLQASGARSVRTRIPTGYVSSEAHVQIEEPSKDLARGVMFQETHDEVDAASVLPPEGVRSSRVRIPTGYVSKEAETQIDEKSESTDCGGVKFR